MTNKYAFFAAGLAVMGGLVPVAQAEDAVPGTFSLNGRARYEAVEQDGKLDAEAFTNRLHLGWESPEFSGFTVLAEVENVVSLGGDDYNSGLNGNTQFASIKDDDVTELQRVQLNWNPSENWSVTAGRQYLGFDGNRFIGTPGHRQDKNSHDAVRADYSRGDFRASYVYQWHLNRGPGDDFDWDTETHLVNASVELVEGVRASGFVYFIDLTDASAPQNRSNMTWGGRLTGGRDIADGRAEYAVMFARQSDYGSAATDFDLGYFGVEGSFARSGATFTAGYEMIEGDGQTSVANPLASNHGTAGWADAFNGGGAMAPVDGLEDVYVSADYGRDVEARFFEGWSAGVTWHDFSGERTGADYGEEWDGHVTANFAGNVSLSYQFADYDGPGIAPAPADRTKQWVVLSYRR